MRLTCDVNYSGVEVGVSALKGLQDRSLEVALVEGHKTPHLALVQFDPHTQALKKHVLVPWSSFARQTKQAEPFWLIKKDLVEALADLQHVK